MMDVRNYRIHSAKGKFDVRIINDETVEINWSGFYLGINRRGKGKQFVFAIDDLVKIHEALPGAFLGYVFFQLKGDAEWTSGATKAVKHPQAIVYDLGPQQHVVKELVFWLNKLMHDRKESVEE